MAAVRDDGSRWGIDLLFSDYKSCGFDLEATHLRAPERLDRLPLSMALPCTQPLPPFYHCCAVMKN